MHVCVYSLGSIIWILNYTYSEKTGDLLSQHNSENITQATNTDRRPTRPRGYKTFFILNSTEQEINCS